MLTVKDLLTHFQSKTEIAEALGVKSGAVTNWGMIKSIPPKRELKIRQELLPGKIWPSDKQVSDELLASMNARLRHALSIRYSQPDEAWRIILSLSEKLPVPDSRHILAAYKNDQDNHEWR